MCRTVKEERRNLDIIERNIQNNRAMLLHEAERLFGPNAFLGRRIEDGWVCGDDVMEILAGRFGQLPYTRPYIEIIRVLSACIFRAANRHQTRELWEQYLEINIEMKRLTNVSFPGVLDQVIAENLLKLHRNDDAISFIVCWLQRLHRLPSDGSFSGDHMVNKSIKGEYPYTSDSISRFDDLIEHIRNCDIGYDLNIPFIFVAICLAIKLRDVCVYRVRSECAKAFCQCDMGQVLSDDANSNIASFLTGGKDAARAFQLQWEHANRLLNYIDENYPFVLAGILEPTILPEFDEDNNDPIEKDQGFDMRHFFETYEGSPPVLEMLTNMLKMRYSSDRYDWIRK